MENNPDRFSVIARSRKQVARPHASCARCDPPISARRSPSSRHLAPINAHFNKLLLQKEELEQKQLHLLQVVESERTSRSQYAQQCDELSDEVKKLRAELCAYKKERSPCRRSASTTSSSSAQEPEVDAAELRKIKKVQSFFRGWLCRRRWKQIVDQYIKSPHAESMRKRNSLVFRMVEAEEEYLEQMEILVTCFLRPFKMAASSKKPPCTHEDVNSIFLNSETVLFLHQIFFKGLTSRMESWPTLVLGDLFDMLLPMLSIYQEYVRNHHYSLQVLTECKQSQPFAQLLARLESKSACQGRSLETFLTYPMHQIPRYIITLHELLAHTPHDHVERRSLQHARAQLEELSRQMHDEVSETENLRKNLAVERMIIEGCDILLDVNQVFIRQGTLSQVVGKGRRASLQSRQAFLFSNHLLLTTRAAGGRLHLPPSGRLPLHDALLVEDPSSHDDDDSTSICSSPGGDLYQNRDFKILVEIKGEQICAHLVAATLEEKAAWTSELAQCMESAALTELLRACGSCSAASASLPACRSDRALFTDDVDIRFSRTLNSCKVPQIRSATPQRLLQRLTDLRFLSVDFLNTFLLTYRVFTDGVTVLEALKQVFYEQSQEPEPAPPQDTTRKTSAASSVSGYGSEYSDREWRFPVHMKSEEDDKLSPFLKAPSRRTSSVKVEDDNSHLTIPKIMATSSSNETLKGAAPSSPGAISSKTLVGSPKKTSPLDDSAKTQKSPTKDNDAAAAIMKDESIELVDQSDEDIKYKEEEQEKDKKYKPEEKFKLSQRFSERVRTMSESPRRLQPDTAEVARRRSDGAREAARKAGAAAEEPRRASDIGPGKYAHRRSISERRFTNSSWNSERRRYWGGSEPRSSVTSQGSQFAQLWERALVVSNWSRWNWQVEEQTSSGESFRNILSLTSQVRCNALRVHLYLPLWFGWIRTGTTLPNTAQPDKPLQYKS
ncbi:Ras-specific guanine nucleotide-releasing factor 1 [Eumeta japonica]|uniref:Ras-specific guanine nucleotide-releasing factor 1 n=1 Tax=Eumeta variegata TaxID=151549 RepID=A0A4C1XCA8_EUMVA|nr:Ras-specific guanine nucleotide-releasing factor 1 [Eumeta japonica]